MASDSRIEWTDTTWNPVTGCSKISEGCKHCYAERMSRRLRSMGLEKYSRGFEVTQHASVLEEPLRWRKPRLVFVNSMSDLFHESVRFEFIKAVFEVMNRCPQHSFQVLTKRPDRALELDGDLNWTPNVLLGVSVESERWLGRLRALRLTSAKARFLSLEPLLGPLSDMDLSDVDWVIAGGESGPGARPVNPDWVREIRDNCVGRGIPFFFKQWGGTNKKRAGRTLDGRTWDEMPIRNTVADGTESSVPG